MGTFFVAVVIVGYALSMVYSNLFELVRNMHGYTCSRRRKEWSKNDFRVLEFRTKGTFGIIHKAKHKTTGVPCAVKTLAVTQEFVNSLPTEHSVEISEEDEILREVEIMKRLGHHPNIICFYGCGRIMGSGFSLVLEWAADGNLRAFLQSKKPEPLSDEVAAWYLRKICIGVHHIHGCEVMHRDLKLENIMLQGTLPKICDFGWSAQWTSTNLRTTVCGTPYSMSPEVIRHRPEYAGHGAAAGYDNKCDLWSIGVMAYELLYQFSEEAGPFAKGLHGDGALEECYRRITNQDTIHHPSFYDERLSEGAKRIIGGFLRHDPGTRTGLQHVILDPWMTRGAA